jgi:transcriptional regulator with XRE-family HTH domain
MLNAMITPKTFRAIRSLRGITQSELAVKAGVSATSIAEFELGHRDIRASTIAKLCEALGVDVTYTVDGTRISGP